MGLFADLLKESIISNLDIVSKRENGGENIYFKEKIISKITIEGLNIDFFWKIATFCYSLTYIKSL